MTEAPPIIEIADLHQRYGNRDAVCGLNLTVQPGRCYGFFGRNGAGKTTTIKCLINLIRPKRGSVRVFGMDPARNEVEVKSRLSYVPDTTAFYPWMTVRDTLEYAASFRPRWNKDLERDLLKRFGLVETQTANAMSKGQRTQLALIAAICPEPELLILDEPTSGLDPLVRREFIQTIIGAYQSGDPEHRTVFVSTHLISEFEGLIDEFTIIDQGRELLSMESDTAREQFHRISARFEEVPDLTDLPGALQITRKGREIEILVEHSADDLVIALEGMEAEEIRSRALSLEEIFLASPHLRKVPA